MDKGELIQVHGLLNEIEEHFNETEVSEETDEVRDVLENNGYDVEEPPVQHMAIHKSKNDHKNAVLQKVRYLSKFATEELEGKERHQVQNFVKKTEQVASTPEEDSSSDDIPSFTDY